MVGEERDLEDALAPQRNGSRRAQRRLHAADALCNEYPKLLRAADIPADTCILAVRMGIDVFQYLGFRTKPLPVKVTAHNAAAVALRDAGITPDPSNPDEKAYEVLLGFSKKPRREGTYNGHLIFVVDEQLAVDLTAHQLAVKTKGLDVPPLYFPVTREFITGVESIGITHPEAGWRVIYGPHPEDKDWAASTDYDSRDQRHMLAQAHELAERLKRKYKVKPATRGRK